MRPVDMKIRHSLITRGHRHRRQRVAAAIVMALYLVTLKRENLVRCDRVEFKFFQVFFNNCPTCRLCRMPDRYVHGRFELKDRDIGNGEVVLKKCQLFNLTIFERST